MARYFITHSLLSSWLYAMKENPFEDASSDRDSYAEFLSVLNREPSTPTKAMQNGIDFENLVTDITMGRGDREHQWYDAASKIAKIVEGGILQYKARTQILANGYTLILNGRLDVLKAGIIYDIKFSSGYDVGKYIGSTQHPTYFELVPEAKQFTYLVSNGSAVWTENYFREDAPSIYPIISDFLDWLEVRDLMETYKRKWIAA